MNTWASWGLMWAGFLALWLALDTWMPAPPWQWIAQPTAHMVPLAPKPVKALALSGAGTASLPLTSQDAVGRLDTVALPPSWKISGSARAWFQLGTFFQKLGQANRRPVDVYHWGDSQIEGDRITGVLREHFQNEHGGQGAGWVMPLTPAPTFAVRQSTSGGVGRVAGFGPRRDVEARRLPFFAVNRFDSASTWTIKNNPKARAHCQTWSDMAIWQEGEGHWDVSPDTDTSPQAPGPYQTWTHAAGLGGSTWRTSGATLLGANLTSGPGVYVHNLAMRGGSGTLFDDVPNADWKALQHHTNPVLVILQFGGNAVPSISNEKGARRYAQKVGQNIRHIQAQWPGVPILFIGPSDMGEAPNTYPGLQHTVAALRDTAVANHALHWDLQAVMGGPGAMAQWVDQRWAGDDHVHFSVRGAREAAQRLLQALAHERALWANQRAQPAKLMAP